MVAGATQRGKHWRIDPRIGLLVLTFANLFALVQDSLWLEIGWNSVLVLMIFFSGRFRSGVKWAATFACILLLQQYVLPVSLRIIATSFSIFVNYARRMFPCLMVGSLMIHTISLREFIVGMRRIHVPQKLIVLFAVLFWKLTSKAVSAESKRQVLERNMQYSRICHDLKTPMTSAQGVAAALRDGKINPEEQQEIFQIIYDKSCYMNELVESMFAYAKMETDEFQLQYKNQDLGALVRSVVALHYDEFEKREMDLQLDISDQSVFCSLDEKEMKRAIGNLVVNAYKHNPNKTTVLVQVKRQKNNAYLTVADNGGTIPTEQEYTLFDPFMCGDEARSSGGNGLGLTISRLIIRKHGGDLYLDKKISGYTKGFVCRIPCLESDKRGTAI